MRYAGHWIYHGRRHAKLTVIIRLPTILIQENGIPSKTSVSWTRTVVSRQDMEARTGPQRESKMAKHPLNRVPQRMLRRIHRSVVPLVGHSILSMPKRCENNKGIQKRHKVMAPIPVIIVMGWSLSLIHI